jgi:hypothetical protein
MAGRPLRRLRLALNNPPQHHFWDDRLWSRVVKDEDCVKEARAILAALAQGKGRVKGLPDGDYAIHFCGDMAEGGSFFVVVLKDGAMSGWKTAINGWPPAMSTPVISHKCLLPLTAGGTVWLKDSKSAFAYCTDREKTVEHTVYDVLVKAPPRGMSAEEIINTPAAMREGVTRSEALVALRRMFFLRELDQVGVEPVKRDARFKISFGKANPKRVKKVKVSESARNAIAMAHSLRGGAGAGKYQRYSVSEE